MKKNCIYRFLNCDDEIIYIGKATDLDNRFKGSNHNHLPTQCYIETHKIEFTSFDTEYEMDLAERYYIPKYKPKYNTQLNKKNIKIKLSEFENKTWTEYIFPNSESKKSKYLRVNNGTEIQLNQIKYCFVRSRSKKHFVYVEIENKKQLMVKSFIAKKDAINLSKRIKEKMK